MSLSSENFPPGRNIGPADAYDTPPRFDPGLPPHPEVDNEGMPLSIKSALLDVEILNWSLQRLGEEMTSPGTIDQATIQAVASKLIQAKTSLLHDIERTLGDLERMQTLRNNKI